MGTIKFRKRRSHHGHLTRAEKREKWWKPEWAHFLASVVASSQVAWGGKGAEPRLLLSTTKGWGRGRQWLLTVCLVCARSRTDVVCFYSDENPVTAGLIICI